MTEQIYTDMSGWRYVVNVVAKTTPEYERGVVDGMRAQLRANNRPWGGLTEDEIWGIWHDQPKDGAITVSAFAHAIETKLKERNK